MGNTPWLWRVSGWGEANDNHICLMSFSINENTTRQIWVERNGNRRIIKANILANGFPFKIDIINKLKKNIIKELNKCFDINFMNSFNRNNYFYNDIILVIIVSF